MLLNILLKAAETATKPHVDGYWDFINSKWGVATLLLFGLFVFIATLVALRPVCKAMDDGTYMPWNEPRTPWG